MIISKIIIENYRWIKDKQEINLSNFSSVVWKNDSWKSIVLNAIASFLDTKNFCIVDNDFNDLTNQIVIECSFNDNNIKTLIKDWIKKVKKIDWLDEFIEDILFDWNLIIRKTIDKSWKAFKKVEFLMKDSVEGIFSNLYIKNDDELNKIISDFLITIPVSGTWRNSKIEKIKYIKEYCNTNWINIINKYVLADEYKIENILPQVELFVSDYWLEADTSFKTNSVSEIQDFFIKETENNTCRLKQIENDIQTEMNKEAESIKKYMKDYAWNLEDVRITPNISWKDSIKSVDVSFKFLWDTKHINMSHKWTWYRRLFMVARFRYLAEKNKWNNIIYLIEEPETFLHPSAQQDLLDSIKDLSEDNQIIITTHSPVFAWSTDYKSLILCTKNWQSIYENWDVSNKNLFIKQIVNELWIKPHYNLVDNFKKIIFVESKNDRLFLDIISQKVIWKKLIDNEYILVLPFWWGEDIESFLNIDYFEKSWRELFLIIDSDKHVNNEAKQQQRIVDFCNKPNKKWYILNKSCIENYYHPRVIERLYSLDPNIFDFFADDEKVRDTIKEKIKEKSLEWKQIKEKNNIKIFESTTKEEFDEIVEAELIDFLKEILID
jgi:putative ATP-dependent endonuclease of the OLD family